MIPQLGVFKFCMNAIDEHYNEHQGRYPKQIILHPISFSELMNDENMKRMISISNYGNPLKFRNVLFTHSYESGVPKLINWKNEVIYL